MSRIELIAANQPLAQRMAGGLRYPLTGAGLATCIALALCWYLTLLPSIAGLAVAILIWITTFTYAIECMVQTAAGYAKPPEVALPDRASNSRAMLWLHFSIVLL